MEIRPENWLDYDQEVIYDITLVTGQKYRGNFRPPGSDIACPRGWVSFDLYDDPQEAWIHLNPSHIVSVQVWLT